MPPSTSLIAPLTNTASDIDGASLIAACLQAHGVATVYGVVGIPVVEVAHALQHNHISFLAFRNEQSASYAASIAPLLQPSQQLPLGVCLCVAGAGVIHAMAGVVNAWANCTPFLLISSGVTATPLIGSFQETPTLDCLKPLCKLTISVNELISLPVVVERAVRVATSGRPGPVAIEIEGSLITSTITRSSLPPITAVTIQSIPKPMPEPAVVQQCIELLKYAKRPLLIVGKGALYSRCEPQLQALLALLPIPTLTQPMCKGLLSDLHRCCVNAARSRALMIADVIILLGTRLNWQLYLGNTKRINAATKLIQIDISAEALNVNRPSQIAIQADCRVVLEQMIDGINTVMKEMPSYESWLTELQHLCVENHDSLQRLTQPLTPLTYYYVYECIRRYLPTDQIIVVNEGANTMDIGRNMLQHTKPRRRLDAGTAATMGIGMGSAIAASHALKRRQLDIDVLRVVYICGDSAFGFSMAEVETALRYKLAMLILIFNNSGIYQGSEVQVASDDLTIELASTSLSSEFRYDRVVEGMGGIGYCVREHSEVESTLKQAWTQSVENVVCVNFLLDKRALRKQQKHAWLTTKSSL